MSKSWFEKNPKKTLLTFWIIILILIELSARFIYSYKQEINFFINNLRDPETVLDRSQLDAYEMIDPQNKYNWILKPNLTLTLAELLEDKKDKPLAYQVIKEKNDKLGVQPDDIIVRINNDGFKGPEIDKNHSKLRIMTIGDSCTYGTHFDEYSYPRTIEKYLNKNGYPVEVINAGVEGYAPQNVLYRIEELKALKPEITTIYIGWNALYGDDSFYQPADKKGFLKNIYTVRLVVAFVEELTKGTAKEEAIKELTKEKNPDINAKELALLDDYAPSFMKNLEEIIQEMQSTGSQVVLITLPGLLSTSEPPSEKALQIGHLPTFTNNPYVLAKMSEKYNERLRKIAKKYSIPLIDLEKWANQTLQPKDEYFFDSVHLYEKGQQLIGEKIAQDLLNNNLIYEKPPA